MALPLMATNAAAAGMFAPYQAYPVGSWPEAVAIGDVTGDGRADVVMTTSYYFDPANDFRLFVFAQAADGTLEPPVSYPTASTYTDRAESVAIGDITGDGRADVVLGLGGLGIQIFPQDPSGTLGTPTLTPTTDSDRIRLGHLDADGHLDVAGVGWGSNTVSVLLNDGAGGLGTAMVYPARHGGYDDLEVADVTGDGRDDLVVMSGQTYAIPNLSVLGQLPAGGFGPAAEYSVGTNTNTNGIGVGDVNGDGRNDVVASYGGNSPTAFIGVFSQNTDGALTGPASHTSYDIPEPVEVADLDLDGRADIVTLHGGWNEAGVYRQLPDGSLSTETLYPIPYASHYDPHGLAVGDINSDGYPDIVLADYNHGLVVLRNRPAPPATVPGTPTLLAPKVGDSRVELSWVPPASDGGSAIIGYDIYRGIGNGGGPLLASVGPVASYADATAVNGTTYYYEVSAVNSVGEGPRSAPIAATPATVPGAPTLVSATAGDGSVALAWTAPASSGWVADHRLYRDGVPRWRDLHRDRTRLHGQWADQRHDLRLHGRGAQRRRVRRGIEHPVRDTQGSGPAPVRAAERRDLAQPARGDPRQLGGAVVVRHESGQRVPDLSVQREPGRDLPRERRDGAELHGHDRRERRALLLPGQRGQRRRGRAAFRRGVGTAGHRPDRTARPLGQFERAGRGEPEVVGASVRRRLRDHRVPDLSSDDVRRRALSGERRQHGDELRRQDHLEGGPVLLLGDGDQCARRRPGVRRGVRDRQVSG